MAAVFRACSPGRRRGAVPARLLVAVAAAMLALAGCREAEQGRVLRYDKGVYLGAPDTPLAAESRQALRERASRQGAF